MCILATMCICGIACVQYPAEVRQQEVYRIRIQLRSSTLFQRVPHIAIVPRRFAEREGIKGIDNSN